jgi:hypothetical protein
MILWRCHLSTSFYGVLFSLPSSELLSAQETLTPVHMEFLRVCLKVKVYHIAAQLLDHSAIYDIAVSTGSGNSSLAEGI